MPLTVKLNMREKERERQTKTDKKIQVKKDV